MKSSQRVFINTFAQYTRTIINMLLSLYTVRVVLLTLGNSDYGIYTLIAGVVSMLSFITNSLVVTTQRFVSYYQGQGVIEKVKDVFNNSLILHIIIGLLVVSVLEILTPFLFDGFLNIPEERISAAKLVYQFVVIILLFTFSAAPFRALLVSHENIVYISIVDILDGILKVILVTIMTFMPFDKLVFYSIAMLAIQICNFLLLSVYCKLKYEECCYPSISRFDQKYLKELTSFAGWSLYSTGCIVGRQQGIAIVLNKVFGAVINAAYGIGFQIAGYTNFLSSALVNAISPQIIKAEGAGDRKRALWLSNVASKFIFFLLSAICIPCMFEINNILTWWLKQVPEHADMFCIMVMLTLLADSLSVGLMYINQAIGKIGLYTLVMSTPKLLTLLFVVIALHWDMSLTSVAMIYVGIELFCSILRVPFIHRTAGLNIGDFLKNVIAREIVPVAICALSCLVITKYLDFQYRFILTVGASMIIYGISIYLVGMNQQERNIINGLLLALKNKIK